MITKLNVYISQGTYPYKNLAIEEFLTMNTQPGECILYLWQNHRTVVIGKNQNAWKECNIQQLNDDGGHLVRRLSGGGAVYHDAGNLNFTFCVREADYDVDRQLSVIVAAVAKAGICAQKTGRNDITVDGRKFSGNAFFKSKGFCYHHGTILLHADQQDMSRYLHVSADKLQSKGVDSVRSRTINLKELAPDLTIQGLKDHLIQAFSEVYGCPVQYYPENVLTQEEIEARTKFFASTQWILGRKIPFEHVMKNRFPWGEIEIHFHVNEGMIRDVQIFTDAMEQNLSDVMSTIFINCPYDKTKMSNQIAQLVFDSPNQHQIKQDILHFIQSEMNT